VAAAARAHKGVLTSCAITSITSSLATNVKHSQSTSYGSTNKLRELEASIRGESVSFHGAVRCEANIAAMPLVSSALLVRTDRR
jgi:hypothetical protein